MGEAVDQRSEATRLGSYEILRKLARGGMAELFLARTVGPEGFEKLVVLKKILPTFAENPKFVRLFLDEARLAATLDHPHIAHVYDMGKVEGHYFFTMEYIHGQDVRATLRRTSRIDNKFPIDHAIQIAHAIASALHYAHERRTPDGRSCDIVHRDVSPSNVLISYDGAIKLVDFGVAKAATSSVKTRTGTLKGKISYMSPEQAKGSPIDRRSDIFSLGIVLWEMVTTQRLFKADNDLATIQLIINSRPQAPTELRPDCPPELERIVLKALSADLDARYQTAEELQLELEELAREHKLKQSSIALRSHMHELFAEEIRAWKAAQASGVTLTDHVVSASVVEMTTPVSENEVSFLDDDEDEDGSQQQPTQGVFEATTNINPKQSAQPGPQPAVVVGRVDHTPLPRSGTIPPNAPTAIMSVEVSQSGPVNVARTATGPMYPAVPPPIPIGHQPSGPVRQLSHTPSGVVRVPTMPAVISSPPHGMPQVHEQNPFMREHATSEAGFPIAPREWRASESPELDLLRQHRAKQLLIGGTLVLAVVAILALALGGSAAPPASAEDMKPEPVTRPDDLGHAGASPDKSDTGGAAVNGTSDKSSGGTSGASNGASTNGGANSASGNGTSGNGTSNAGASANGNGATGTSNTGTSNTGTSNTGTSNTGTSNTGTSNTGTSGTGTGASGTRTSNTGATSTSNTGTSGNGTSNTGTSGNGKSNPTTGNIGKSNIGTSDTGTPDATKKLDTKTTATKSDIAKTKSDTAKPDATKTTKPDTNANKTTKTDAAKTNVKSDAAKVGITGSHHTATPDTVKADAAKADAAKADATKHHGTTTKTDTKAPDKSKDTHAGSAAQHYDPNSALPPP